MAKRKYLKIDDPLRYELKRIKGNKKKNLFIMDKQTKKRVSYERFQKLFDLTRSELDHLKSNEVIGLYAKDLNKYFSHFEGHRNFQFLLDTNQLDDLQKYRIRYADKSMPFHQLEDKIYAFIEKIERNYYKFMINVNVIKGVAHVTLIYEIILHQFDDVSSYTDQMGNFILWSSK